MKLGVLLAGRRPQDIAERLAQSREAGFSLCQLNFLETGFTRADLIATADSMLEYGIRALAVGCYVNPLRPDEPSTMGTTRADLDLLLRSLDIIGARRVVFWSGTHAEALYDEHPENATEESLEKLRQFVLEVARSCSARTYYLVIEPWHTHVLNSENRIADFHASLPQEVSAHVRYVLDVPNLLTPERYLERDKHMRTICRTIGRAAGVVHLKDCVMPPDGEPAFPGPGLGKLNYAEYLKAIFEYAAPDAPAILRNIPASQFAAARDYLLRMSDKWELA
ncbi:MAG TPA: TIM barrel protein [Chthonomonadales bacterium]|nr:TIM barrel protein [Chthonomonadales bacterium]